MAKKVTLQLTWMSFLQNHEVTTISVTKVWSDPKVYPQIDKDLNP